MASQNQSILITGCSGFLGSHLLKALASSENYRIIGLKRSWSDTWRIKEVITQRNMVLYDVDVMNVEDVFAREHIDIVVHTATEYGRMGVSSASVLESNLIFPIRVLECAAQNSASLFINTDSYFNKADFTYTSLLNYSLSKKCFLTWLKYYSRHLKVANMVLEHIYGEGDSESKFVEGMIQKIAIEQADSVNLTHGHQKRDFIHVADVVDAYIQVIRWSQDNAYQFKNFNVGTGVSTQVSDFVRLIKEISHSNTQLNFGSIPYRDDEIMNSVADLSELRGVGWRGAQISVESGIRRIIESYKRDRNP